MVLMRRLMNGFDDCASDRIECRRGAMSSSESAARTKAEHMSTHQQGATPSFAHMHEEITDRLDHLQQRIERLNEGLESRRTKHVILPR